MEAIRQRRFTVQTAASPASPMARCKRKCVVSSNAHQSRAKNPAIVSAQSKTPPTSINPQRESAGRETGGAGGGTSSFIIHTLYGKF
jgi:hypothetical protein